MREIIDENILIILVGHRFYFLSSNCICIFFQSELYDVIFFSK